jgi:hypothetical protein
MSGMFQQPAHVSSAPTSNSSYLSVNADLIAPLIPNYGSPILDFLSDDAVFEFGHAALGVVAVPHYIITPAVISSTLGVINHIYLPIKTIILYLWGSLC